MSSARERLPPAASIGSVPQGSRLTSRPSRAEAIGPDLVARDLKALIGVALLCFVMPWLLLANLETGVRGSAWMVFLAVVVWSGARVALLIADGRPALFSYVFWLFTYVFMGVGAMVQFGTGQIAYTTPRIIVDYDLTTAFVVLAGVAAFELGSVATRRLTPDRWALRALLPAPMRTDRVVRATADHTRSMVLVLVSAPICAFYVSRIGLGPLFSNRETRIIAGQAAFPEPTVLAILAAFSWVPALVAMHRIVGERIRRRGTGYRLGSLEVLTVAVATVMLVLVNNPISSSRYGFGSMVLSFLPMLGAFATVQRSRRSLVAIAVSLLVAFPMADAFRTTERGEFSFSLVDEYPLNPDYDTTAQLHNAIRIVDEDGVTWLQQPLGTALFWVPRSIWPGKPIDTGNFIAVQRDYDFQILSAPLWAELYLIAGWASVIVGFVALGWFFVRLDRRTTYQLLAGGAYPLGASFMAFYLFILLRGSLLQAMAIPAAFAAAAWFSTPPRLASQRIPSDETTGEDALDDDLTESQRRVLSRWTRDDDHDE